jgi:hypothetical protein
VERRDGQTLQTELQVAYNSSPDAIGLISWNEFSENSHIEPSQNHGMRYLELLADFNNVILPVFDTFNSSDPPIEEEKIEQIQVVDRRGGIVVLVSAILLVLVIGISALQRRST